MNTASILPTPKNTMFDLSRSGFSRVDLWRLGVVFSALGAPFPPVTLSCLFSSSSAHSLGRGHIWSHPHQHLSPSEYKSAALHCPWHLFCPGVSCSLAGPALGLWQAFPCWGHCLLFWSQVGTPSACHARLHHTILPSLVPLPAELASGSGIWPHLSELAQALSRRAGLCLLWPPIRSQIWSSLER